MDCQSVCQLPSDVATGLPGSGLVKVGQPEVAHCGDLVNCRRHEAVVSERVLLLRDHSSKGGAEQVGVSTGSCRPWCCAPVSAAGRPHFTLQFVFPSVPCQGSLFRPTHTTTQAYVVFNMWSPCIFF